MTPNIDDRLASVIRALTEVVLPHLPPEASLAQEQVHLAVGHLQILRAQIDAVPAFEQDELADAKELGQALLTGVSGSAAVAGAQAALRLSIQGADGAKVRDQHQAINDAVATVIAAVYSDGDATQQAALSKIILEQEHVRVQKDRHWLLPFGFDTMVAAE
jgi:hypothetical protein